MGNCIEGSNPFLSAKELKTRKHCVYGVLFWTKKVLFYLKYILNFAATSHESSTD